MSTFQKPIAVTVGIHVSLICPPFLVPSTHHLFLLASFAPCTSFLSIFRHSGLFPSASMQVIAFSSRLYQMPFHIVHEAHNYTPLPFWQLLSISRPTLCSDRVPRSQALSEPKLICTHPIDCFCLCFYT